MDAEEGFDRYRYKTRVQVVAIIDIVREILVGTLPFMKLTFALHDKALADEQDREYLVLGWMTLLCVYVLQLIMGIWLLAATRECYYEYTVGNCQVWYYIAMFTFVFYIGEMGYDISVILKPHSKESVSKVVQTMLFHATKIIYRAITLMIINNFLFDLCRPVYKFLSQGSYMYTSYYNYRLGIPPPRRRRRLSSVTTQLITIKRIPIPASTTTQDTSGTLTTTTTIAGLGLPPAAAALAKFRQQYGQPEPLPYVIPPPIIPPPPPTPAPAVLFAPPADMPPVLPVYNSTKIPLQPIPNHNFYFTYPQPKPKPYRDTPYDMSVAVNSNYPYCYYDTQASMNQPP